MLIRKLSGAVGGASVTNVAELTRLLASGVPLHEAKKKLAGNLCVNTGQGSGGGFTACTASGSQAALASVRAIRARARETTPDAVAPVQSDPNLYPPHGYVNEYAASFGDSSTLAGSKAGDPALAEAFGAFVQAREAEVTAQRAEHDIDQAVYVQAIPSYKGKPFESSIRGKWTKDIPAKQIPLARMEDEIALRSHEKGAIYDLAGNLLWVRNGTAHYVKFSHRQTKAMRNAVLTHNHPNSLGFSHDDIAMAAANDLAEIRAVGAVISRGKVVGRTTYSLKRPEGGWPKDAPSRVRASRGSAEENQIWESARSHSNRQMGAGMSINHDAVIRVNLATLRAAGIPESSYSVKVDGSFLDRPWLGPGSSGQKFRLGSKGKILGEAP